MNKEEKENKRGGQAMARRQLLMELADRMGVRFVDFGLLDRALTHTSYANEHDHVQHNERLEFLGDAVLELASSTYLYERFPNLPEGELTKMRASLVCSQSLAELANELGLGGMLRLGHGEEASGGRERRTNLEDAFEAVIGAIYLDQGWPAAAAFVRRELEDGVARLTAKAMVDYQDDAKTRLQELVFQQAKPDDPGASVVYEELSEQGPDHAKEFAYQVRVLGQVLGQGTGPSKKAAQQAAAREALQAWEKSLTKN